MSAYTAIVAEIEALVARRRLSYEVWTIGVTGDPDRRRAEHENSGKDTQRWHQWDDLTALEARTVELRFLNMHMQGGSGGPSDADYVYVF